MPKATHGGPSNAWEEPEDVVTVSHSVITPRKTDEEAPAAKKTAEAPAAKKTAAKRAASPKPDAVDAPEDDRDA